MILSGRLAVHQFHKGNGYGELILLNVLNRCFEISVNLGTWAVIVDPIDESAEKFYSKYGFILLPGTGKMFLPITTIEDSLGV